MHDFWTSDQSAPRPRTVAEISRRADLIPALLLPLLLLLAALSGAAPAASEPVVSVRVASR